MKWRSIASVFVDHPSVVTILGIGLIAMQFVFAALWWPFLDPSQLFLCLPSAEQRSSVSSIATGLAGVAAMVGGFAGVVVVFGLSSEDERFRVVRLRAVSSLRKNWTSVVTTPLVAAFGALFAAAAASAGHPSLALWTLEVCVFLAGHGAVRLVVILRELVKVVHRADESARAGSSVLDTDEFFSDL